VFAVAASAAIVAALTGIVGAQSGSIAGRASDLAGQALPGVTVMMMPESGGAVRQTTTAANGIYRFENVQAGTYRVDFELPGFDGARRNHVLVGTESRTGIDATLWVRPICECVVHDFGPVSDRSGQVINAAGRPLPRARIEIVLGSYHEKQYTDREGRFSVRGPVDRRWQMIASDTGFPAVTQLVSSSDAGPIVFKLAFAGTTGSPDSERLEFGCGCPGLFTHSTR
jgi:hypothetical protein